MNLKHLAKFEGEETPPHPKSEIQGFRSLGYNFHTAVADIIDNSIAAKARNIWIDFKWNGDRSYFIITDDGHGMTKENLIEAMRLGTQGALIERNEDDLGRFGLGLKTASFSQCLNLVVASKQDGRSLVYRCWDINYVSGREKWVLLKYISDKSLLKRLKGMGKGTSVIWQQLDQLGINEDANDSEKMNVFLEAIGVMERHLSMVFHYYMEKKNITIWVNERKLAPWDPYLKTHDKTRKFSHTVLRNGIEVTSYILPTYIDMPNDEFVDAGGIKGWNAQQGLYVYRNKRILISGEWLGMYKQEEHCKLARIMVNFPATAALDKDWRIDIKKSMIQLPNDLKHRLRDIADETRREAVIVYRKLAKKKVNVSVNNDISVWHEYKWKGHRRYKINKGHPIIKDFIENSGEKMFVGSLLRLIEETVPLSVIVKNENQPLPFAGKSMADLIKLIVNCYKTLIESGLSDVEATDAIRHTEPFNHYPELLVDLSRLE